MGATIALGENGKIALAHISRDARMDADDKQNAIAGESMQHPWGLDRVCTLWAA